MIALTAKVKVQGKNDFIENSPYSMKSTTQSEISFVPDARGLIQEAPLLKFTFTLPQGADSAKFDLGKSFTVIFVGNDDE